MPVVSALFPMLGTRAWPLHAIVNYTHAALFSRAAVCTSPAPSSADPLQLQTPAQRLTSKTASGLALLRTISEKFSSL